MTHLPPEQKLLHDGFAAKIAGQPDETALVRCMGGILHSLLRRAGDAPFLAAVGDAFTAGISGRSIAEQRAIAHEVVALVISKRPEIALAWQRLYGRGRPGQYARRAADQPPPAPPVPEPAAAPAPAPDIPKLEQEDAPYGFASSEEVVADYLAEVLRRRLGIFRITPPHFPSIAYCHERPFFLFTAEYEEVVVEFATGPLLKLCRVGLERRVYRHARPDVLNDAAQRRAFLEQKRPEVWKIVTEKLVKLAAAQKNAEAKMALAATGRAHHGPHFKMVDVPHSRPRVYNIFGVKFSLGTETVTRKVKVKTRPPTELDKDEVLAMQMLGELRDTAADRGMDLPTAADFQFLRTLFEFDAKRFAQAAKEFSALAGHKETTRAYMFERLKYLDQTYNNVLSDIVVVMLFYEHGDGKFGFDELYEVCVGTALDKSAQASKRPFVQQEVGRRPAELALQLREALAQRRPTAAVEQAATMLVDSFARMARVRFHHELDAALTVLGAFPLAFSGEPDEASLSAIGKLLRDGLSAKEMDRNALLAGVSQAYGRIGGHPAAA